MKSSVQFYYNKTLKVV